MPNPSAFLKSVSKKLVSGGKIVGSVPNVRYLPVMFQYLILRDWRYNPQGGVLDDTHLRFFTRKSLIRTVVGTGCWQIERTKYLTAPVYQFSKFLLSLIVWPLGLDVLKGQIGFVAKKKIAQLTSGHDSKVQKLIPKAEARLKAGENLFGGRRDLFALPVDETLPKYLLDNRERFKHLFFEVTPEYLQRTAFARKVATLRGICYRFCVRLVPRFLVGPLSTVWRWVNFR